jgi:hypothetical protein
MTGLITARKNEALDGWADNLTHASLHSGATGGTGANELSGGTPAYARKAITWGAAAAGSKSNITSSLVFDVPAGASVAYVGFWDAASAGNFQGDYAASSPADEPGAVFTALAADDIFTAPGHAFDLDDQVVLVDTGNAALPTGVAENTTYWVRDVTATGFKLAATQGGAAINLTADGAGFVFSQTVETFAGQGTYTIAVGDIVLDLLGLT